MRDEGARRPRGRGDGRLVRRSPPARRGPARDRGRRGRRGPARGARRRAALRAGRPVGLRGPLRRTPSLGLGRDRRLPRASLLLPLALLPLAAPLARPRRALPELGAQHALGDRTQTSIKSHYAAVVDRRRSLVAAAFGAARLGAPARAISSPRSPRSSRTRPARARSARVDVRADEHDAAARRALRLIPGDAAVSATNSLGAHLSARRRIFSFPVLEDADWVAVDETRPDYLDSLKPGRGARDRSPRSSATRAGGSSSPRTASSSSAALERDRLRQQVGAEAEREQLRAAVVVGGSERQRPDRVPGRRATASSRAAGSLRSPRSGPAAHGLARQPDEPGGERERGQRRARRACGTPSCSSRCGSA